MAVRRRADVLWILAVGTGVAWSGSARAQQSQPSSSAGAESAARPSTEALVELHLAGLLQVDAVLWNEASVDELDPASSEPLNDQRFLLRRGRIRVDAVRGVLHGQLTLDANTVDGPVVRVLSAELGVGWPPAPAAPSVAAVLGLFLIPFGFETLEAAATRLFLEPSQWVRAIFPGRRDLGARLQGRIAFLRADVALVNGNPSSSAEFPLRDPNAAKDLLGRLGVDAELWPDVRVRAGSSLLLGRGFHAGRAETKDSLVWRDANEDGLVQSTELQVIAGAPAERSRNFDRFALGGDLVVDSVLPLLGPLRVYAELLWAENADRGLYPADPIASGRDQRELGFTLGLRQALTRHAEIGVRFDQYRPDLDASEAQGARLVAIDETFASLAFAAAWCSLPGFRLTLEYDRNQNPLGRSASGQPTTLAADVLTLRGQLEL